MLYGAPIYALLTHIGRANWLTAALVGVAPGVGALLIGIFPTGRLADANLTIGPMVMICGLFLALATHALVGGAATLQPPSSQTLGRFVRASALPLARVFLVGAILGQVWTFIRVRNSAPGTFAALGFVSGAAAYVAPFLLAAVAGALYSYITTAKPRGAPRVFEIAGFLLVGIVLLVPAAYVLRIL